MASAASAVVRIANARGGEGFVAVSAEARKRFWLDRARTAAIARHTNAFKINEDVVIPLDKLGEYTDGVERINIEFSVAQQARLCWTRWRSISRASCRCPEDKARCWATAPARALELLRRVRGRWQAIAADLDHYFDQLQSYALRLSWKTEVRDELRRHVRRRRVPRCSRRRGSRCTSSVLRGRVFVALHMHAGDGNVHTNIPVNSDDYEMLQARNRRGRRASCASRARSAA